MDPTTNYVRYFAPIIIGQNSVKVSKYVFRTLKFIIHVFKTILKDYMHPPTYSYCASRT